MVKLGQAFASPNFSKAQDPVKTTTALALLMLGSVSLAGCETWYAAYCRGDAAVLRSASNRELLDAYSNCHGDAIWKEAVVRGLVRDQNRPQVDEGRPMIGMTTGELLATDGNYLIIESSITTSMGTHIQWKDVNTGSFIYTDNGHVTAIQN